MIRLVGLAAYLIGTEVVQHIPRERSGMETVPLFEKRGGDETEETTLDLGNGRSEAIAEWCDR